MWQHRVGPFVANGPGGYDKARPELDQNRIPGELPLIGATPTATELHPETEDHDDDGFDVARDELAIAEFSLTTWLDGELHAPRNHHEDPIL